LQIIVALALNALALIVTAYVVPGFEVADFTTAILAAIVLGIVNTFIRPVLAFMTAPLTIISLGLFAFVINALMLYIVAYFVPGITIAGFVPAILAAVVLSVVATALSMLLGDLAKLKLK
jgi:putative membrane protein